MPKGFFSPTAWTGGKLPLPLEPLCGLCGLHKHCQSPYMKPSGQGKRKVLMVAEAPGENEDKEGIQLVGNAGIELIKILWGLGVEMRRDCWLHNAVVCRPKDQYGKNRTPSLDEVRHCQPNLVKALKSLNPDVVIPLGETACKSVVALAWKDGEVDSMGQWAGWCTPSRRLNVWICPTYHPSFLLHDKCENLAAGLHMRNHLQKAFSLKGKPYPKGETPDYASRVEVTFDPHRAANVMGELRKSQKPLAFDFETTCLKPDSTNADILCCSVSDGERSVAYPWVGVAVDATEDLIASKHPKIAANLRFEDRWCRKVLGIAPRGWVWDTVLGAHWRNCRHGICALKFQAFVLLGMEDYDSFLEPFIGRDDGDCNKPNRLKEVEPAKLYFYCGMDSLLEVLVAQRQMKDQWEGVT